MLFSRIHNKSFFLFSLKNRSLYITLLIFTILYGLISFVNHYFFRTYALDLGVYTNALFDYARLRWNDSTAFKPNPQNLLSDHFDLYLIIFAPLSWLFGTYTLLIIQIISTWIGGSGIYFFFKSYYPEKKIHLPALIHFLIFFGIFSAIAFDYHSNVPAAMLVPWFFLFFKKKAYCKAVLTFIFILLAKENMALWLVFISFAMMTDPSVERRSKTVLFYLFIGAAVYFILVTTWLMPVLSATNHFSQLKYSVLGDSLGDYLINLISHPIKYVQMLFINHSGEPSADWIKAEFYLFFFLSGGVFLFIKPKYLLMVFPLIAQKMFHDKTAVWGVDAQYSVEFAPLVSICVFECIATLRSQKTIAVLSAIVLFLSLSVTIRLMDQTMVYSDKTRIRFYQARHYQKDYDVHSVHKAIEGIPTDAIVSCQSPFLPHLALRDKIYQFPVVKDASIIVLSEKENAYPLEQNEIAHIIDTLDHSARWEKRFHGSGLHIWKRK